MSLVPMIGIRLWVRSSDFDSNLLRQRLTSTGSCCQASAHGWTSTVGEAQGPFNGGGRHRAATAGTAVKWCMPDTCARCIARCW